MEEDSCVEMMCLVFTLHSPALRDRFELPGATWLDLEPPKPGRITVMIIW